MTAPVLASPRVGQPYEIHTDASAKAIAGTLLQRNPQSDALHPIAFASRCLNKHERNYSIIELEALAIVYSLLQFRPYVFGAKVTVLTDHSPLCSLLHRTDTSGRLAKYQFAIMAYDVEIKYGPDSIASQPIAHHHENVLDGGHLGIAKTLAKLRSKYYWKNMASDVKKYVNACEMCQKTKSPTQLLHREELSLYPIPSRPFQRVHSDVIGLLPTCINGNNYILIHTCAFTKYVICSPITDQKAATVAKTFVNDLREIKELLSRNIEIAETEPTGRKGNEKQSTSDRSDNTVSNQSVVNKAQSPQHSPLQYDDKAMFISAAKKASAIAVGP
ncbi:hypothetical protein OESDEN_00821 [Oesophagostomum dentatum]|uniref:RNA-directed DNA polymerase n=1 Tax=Oesophagostomum dentatum TaxID=61180 RepID=A0A0B1TNU4_OESDE|nr:hypothetical protein OESDEN_00821 [Oesophagostomum dentatum]